MSPRRRKSTADRFADAPLDGPLLEVDDVQTLLQDAARARARGRRRLAHARAGQDASASSASRARASRCSRVRSWACCPSNVVRHGSIKFEGHEIGNADSDDDAPLLGHADVDGVPGPDDLAEPGDADRQADHRVAALPPRRHQGLREGDRARAAAVGRDPRGRAPAARSTRTSSPAGCASA